MTYSKRNQTIVDRKRSFAGIALSAIVFTLTLVMILPAAAGAKLHDKVKNGVYNSPAKNFTVPVPEGMGMQVSDGYGKEDDLSTGAVSFHDDWGTLVGIHYTHVPPEVEATLAQPEGIKSLLDWWLPDFAMPIWFLSASPESRVLHQEFGSFEGLEVLMAQVEIPGGSSLVVQNSSGTRRLDSVRGLVIFHRGGYIYMLTTEMKGLQQVLPPGSAEKTVEAEPERDDQWMRFTETLKPFYQSIEFVE